MTKNEVKAPDVEKCEYGAGRRITFPTPDGVREFELDTIYPIRNVRDITNQCASFNFNSIQKIDLSLEVTEALIDAAQNPVCDICEAEFEDDIDEFTYATCSNCNSMGPDIDISETPGWLPIKLYAIAIFRSRAVIWQWLESLKEEKPQCTT